MVGKTLSVGGEPSPVCCHNCGAEFGRMVDIRSPSGKMMGRWLKMGNIFVSVVYGKCECGSDIQWSPAHSKLQRLLAREEREIANL